MSLVAALNLGLQMISKGVVVHAIHIPLGSDNKVAMATVMLKLGVSTQYETKTEML